MYFHQYHTIDVTVSDLFLFQMKESQKNKQTIVAPESKNSFNKLNNS